VTAELELEGSCFIILLFYPLALLLIFDVSVLLYCIEDRVVLVRIDKYRSPTGM
jgi:hypothetical protein